MKIRIYVTIDKSDEALLDRKEFQEVYKNASIISDSLINNILNWKKGIEKDYAQHQILLQIKETEMPL